MPTHPSHRQLKIPQNNMVQLPRLNQKPTSITPYGEKGGLWSLQGIRLTEPSRVFGYNLYVAHNRAQRTWSPQQMTPDIYSYWSSQGSPGTSAKLARGAHL